MQFKASATRPKLKLIKHAALSANLAEHSRSEGCEVRESSASGGSSLWAERQSSQAQKRAHAQRQLSSAASERAFSDARLEVMPDEMSDKTLDGAKEHTDAAEVAVAPNPAREARNSALGYLSRREHSRFELLDKLLRKGYDERLCEEVVAILDEQGLQSDQRFCEVYVRSRTQRGFGPNTIRQELRQRGLDRELIDESVSNDRGHWIALAVQAAEKKFSGPVDSPETWAKRARYLQRRGFSSEHIFAALGDRRG